MLRHARPWQDRRAVGDEVGYAALLLPIIGVAVVLAVTSPLGPGIQASITMGTIVAVLLWVGARVFPDRWLLVAVWQGVPRIPASVLNPDFRDHVRRRSTAYALFLGLIATCLGLVLVTDVPRQRPLLDAALVSLGIVLVADLSMKRWRPARPVIATVAVLAAGVVSLMIAG